MPAMLTDEDFSLRHLPEDSGYSFSFQIPTTSLPKGGDLMAEDNTFFEGANPNITLTTPAPPVRVAYRPPTRMFQEFTPRPPALESSPLPQRSPASPPSETPSTSCGHIESHPSPINEPPISSKQIGSSEEEDLSEEKAQHEYQDQNEPQGPDPCLSASTTTSATLNNILSPHPTFPGRLSLGSRSEAGHSGLDSLPTESRLCASSAASSEGKEEQQGNANPGGSRKGHFGNKSERPMSTRSIPATKPPRQTTISGGILKSRRRKRTAATKSEKGLVKTSLPTIATRALNKRHTKPDKPMGSSDADRSLGSDLSLSSFVPGGGAAGRLVMYSQQLMNTQDDAAGSISQGTEPNYILEQRTMQADGHEIRDVNMDLDPCLTDDTHANNFGNQDDWDKPLTISQLSPRKPSAVQPSAVRQQDNIAPLLPPLHPVLKPIPGASSEKRQALVPPAPRHDQRARKRDRRSPNAVNAEALCRSTTYVPVHTIASTSSGPQSLVASAVSSVPLELGSTTSGAGVESLDVIVENEGGRREVNEGNVAGDEHAKTLRSSEMISTNGCGSSVEVAGSGPPPVSKQVVKRPAGIGARSRTRRVSKLSSAASGGRASRHRSTSNSVSTRANVLRASERGKRLAQIRTRKEGRARDHLGKSAQLDQEIETAGGDQVYTSAGDLKRSDMTSSTRPVEFKFASDLRLQARKGDSQRMTRSTSSLSSSGGAGNNASAVVHPIPDFRMIHAHLDASQAHRKENVHPVIPQPFHWATDERIKQRKEFDDMVKEKERERDLLEEQKRKEREEEEEKEIRELRKRLIPKANVVPDWYKDAPKKTTDEETTG